MTSTDPSIVMPTPGYFPNVWAWAILYSHHHEKDFEKRNPSEPDQNILHAFRQSNWNTRSWQKTLELPIPQWFLGPQYQVSDEFYGNIRPALVLATKFVHYSAGFLDKIWNGHIRSKPLAGNNHKFFLVEPKPEENPAPYMWNNSVLDEISNFQICLGYDKSYETPEYDSDAHIHYGTHPKTKTPRIRTAVLHINTKFTTFFSPVAYKGWSKEQISRVLFFLAVTLGHEMAHLCWRFRWMERVKSDIAYLEEEPYYHEDDPLKELGCAWEKWAFGGSIQMLKQKMTYSKEDAEEAKKIQPYHLGLKLGAFDREDYVRTRGLPGPPGYKVKVVENDLVEAFFDTEAWAAFEALDAYESLAGRNILESMKAAAFIAKYKEAHGAMPDVNLIPDPTLRTERWSDLEILDPNALTVTDELLTTDDDMEATETQDTQTVSDTPTEPPAITAQSITTTPPIPTEPPNATTSQVAMSPALSDSTSSSLLEAPTTIDLSSSVTALTADYQNHWGGLFNNPGYQQARGRGGAWGGTPVGHGRGRGRGQGQWQGRGQGRGRGRGRGRGQ